MYASEAAVTVEVFMAETSKKQCFGVLKVDNRDLLPRGEISPPQFDVFGGSVGQRCPMNEGEAGKERGSVDTKVLSAGRNDGDWLRHR